MRLVVLGVLLGAAVGCGDASLDPLPLSITIEASRTTAAPGDVVSFVVNAQGGSLVGVAIDYGDDSSDQLGTSGARTARVIFSHAFGVAGVYQVRATVTDATAGNQAADVRVTVQ